MSKSERKASDAAGGLLTCCARGFCSCQDAKAFDFGKPTRHEVFGITFISLIASLFFWAVALTGALKGGASATVVSCCLESALDFISTVVVLYRFLEPDALIPSERNHKLEQRSSAACALNLVALALVLTTMALLDLRGGAADGPNELTIEVLLSVPSTVVYLVVGMMQLQVAWQLRLRSVKQDALISLLGAVVSLGTLVSALVNLVSRVEEDEIFEDAAGLPPDTMLSLNTTLAIAAPAVHALREPLIAVHGLVHGGVPTRRVYHYWWLDEVCTIATSVVMLALGVCQLHEDTTMGSKWWTYDFWVGPIPSSQEVLAAAKETSGQPAEATPLFKRDPENGTKPKQTK